MQANKTGTKSICCFKYSFEVGKFYLGYLMIVKYRLCLLLVLEKEERQKMWL